MSVAQKNRPVNLLYKKEKNKMTLKQNLTDDASFRIYLNQISRCSLFEHGKANLVSDLLVQIILRYDHLCADCREVLQSNYQVEAPSSDKAALEALLLNLPEETLTDLMCQTFSKQLLINTLLECSDSYAREDMIYNQEFWDKGLNHKDYLN
jgi:hypothetical protein